MNLLQVQKENIFHILVQILQLFFRIIRKDKFHNSSNVSQTLVFEEFLNLIKGERFGQFLKR